MDEIIIGVFKVQSDFALEVWFSIQLFIVGGAFINIHEGKGLAS